MIKQHPSVSGRVVFPEATNSPRSRSRDENGETHARQQNLSFRGQIPADSIRDKVSTR
jgi:hypothetical protein